MTRIVTIVGARPQFIKASVLSAAIAASRQFDEVLVHTGQHFDANMSDVFFSDLDIAAPTHQLDIHSASHGEMTGRMLVAIEKILLAEKPEVVLVYGDTNSTLAGALAAAKLQIPVAHIEAGLRSFNMAMPEEVNRVVTDRVSRWLFSPTATATQNLLREGVPSEQVIQVGDVMFDVALHYGRMAVPEGGVLQRLRLVPGSYVLVTIHRQENTDHQARLAAIVDAMEMAASDMPVVWPLHPRTRAVLQRMGRLNGLTQRVKVIQPVGYLEMVQLEKYAGVIATDSGGVQKEAFFYDVPCVTVRDETEWVELIEAGWNRLAPPRDSLFLKEAIVTAFGSSGAAIAPYGRGDAARRIVRRLRSDLTSGRSSSPAPPSRRHVRKQRSGQDCSVRC